jgi:hypothetical protein
MATAQEATKIIIRGLAGSDAKPLPRLAMSNQMGISLSYNWRGGVETADWAGEAILEGTETDGLGWRRRVKI